MLETLLRISIPLKLIMAEQVGHELWQVNSGLAESAFVNSVHPDQLASQEAN